jgi:virulence-associated protein VagC
MSETSDTRTVRLLRLGPDQIIEVPVEWEMSCDEVTIVQDGERLVIAPRKGPSNPSGDQAIDQPSTSP